MKPNLKQIVLALSLLVFFGTPAAMAQKEKDKKSEDKDVKAEQIIITKKGDEKEKIVIEIDGDKVTINGKDAKDLKDDDIKVLRHKITDMRGRLAITGVSPRGQNTLWEWNEDMPLALATTSENRALLGVTTERTDDNAGAKVTNVSEKSAAEKAGIKTGDLITKVGDTKIENPDDLTKAIRSYKPGDKVKVTYKREKKVNTTEAELGKWTMNLNYNFVAPKMKELNLLREMEIPRVDVAPNVRGFSQQFDNWSYFNEDQRLGLSVQDTEDGKGVKVLEVDEESNAAKAGIKENDIITEFAGNAVNSADEVAKLYREKLRAKEAAVPVKILRNGKTQNVEIKVPRKLKTADL